MNSKLLEHLRARPIAPIVNASTETDNEMALKLMCIIDYQLENNRLYPELRSSPKLMGQLLNLYSFGSFKYFKYKVSKQFAIGGMLKCKHCELIGPYIVVLEHMTINHNIHINTKLCMWCEKTDFQTHISENTIHQCYQACVNKFSSKYVPPVVAKFYMLLEKLATKLKVKTIRRENFKNELASKKFEIIPHDQTDDIDQRIIIFRAKSHACKNLDAVALETLYQTAMKSLLGPAAFTQFTHKVIDSDNNLSPPEHLCEIKLHPIGSDGPAQYSTTQSSSQSHLQFDQVNLTGSMATAASQATASIDNDNEYMKFIGSLLENIRNAELRTQAKLEIQRIAITYSGQDVMQQIGNSLYQT